MAAGLQSAQDATGSLNLGSLIGGKVKNALAMSAEERKARDEEIKLLQEKVDAKKATQKDIVRLEELEGQKSERSEGGFKKSFFAKALASEFGGDRRRRLAGTFSKDPDATQDPSLTKEQRFSALLDKSARPGETPIAPATPAREDDDSYLSGAPEGAVPPQQSSLDKILETIKAQYAAISSKVGNLGSEEQKDVEEKKSTNAQLSRVTGVLESLKQYFNKDNELQESEQQLEREKVEIERDAQEDAKVQQEASQLSGTSDNAGLGDTDTLEEQKERSGGGDGLLGNIFGGLKGLIGKFMGGKKGGGPKGATQYTKPIGPQPMNSATPWASKGAGDRGGMFGSAGFTPRMSSAPTKPTPLNAGGVIAGEGEKLEKFSGGTRIASNPNVSRLSPGSAVIPLNRNNGLARTMRQAGQAGDDVQTTQKLAEGAELVPKTGGGLLLTLLNKAMKKLGGLGSMFKGPILGMARGVTDYFGLPQTMLSSMFGGSPSSDGQPEEADNPRRKKNIFDKLKGMLGMKTRGNPMAPGTGPVGSGAAANLSGTGVVGEVDMNSIKQGLGAGQQGSGGAVGHADVGLTTKFGQSKYHGRHHNGVDIGTSGKTGYMVGFKRSGTVVHSGPAGTYGNLVIIKDDDGVEYYFGHLKTINTDLKVGSAYTGQTIGEIGNTGGGLSSGEHLHFEKRPPGSEGVDPLPDVGLLDIGKQTQSQNTSPGDARAVSLGGLNNGTSPVTVTPEMQKAAPELTKLIQQSQSLSRQSGARTQAPYRGLSTTSVYNTSLSNMYYFQF